MTMPPRILMLAALPLLAACQPGEQAAPQPESEVAMPTFALTGAWCRPTPNGARAGACYVTLSSQGRDDRLVGVTTPAAEVVMIHQMSTGNGVMRMSEMEGGLPLPADTTVTLEPSGTHLMLTQLKGPLVRGTTVPLRLDFEVAPDVTVEAQVRPPAN
jgi:periplasmic copper chaperone A